MSFKIIVRVRTVNSLTGQRQYADIEINEEQILDLAYRQAKEEHGYDFIDDAKIMSIVP